MNVIVLLVVAALVYLLFWTLWEYTRLQRYYEADRKLQSKRNCELTELVKLLQAENRELHATIAAAKEALS